MAAPLFAAEPITITATVSGQTDTTADITIGYSGASGVKPAGIAMIVDLTVATGSAKIASAADVLSVGDSFFDVFIDFAADDPDAYEAGADPNSGAYAGAHPVARSDAAGTPFDGNDVTVFALCMGELENPGTVGASNIELVKFRVTKIAAPVTMRISADPLRGGELPGPIVSSVVDQDANLMAVTWPADTNLFTIDTSCVAPTCRGDVNGDNRVRTNDITAMVQILNGVGYPYVCNSTDPCFDGNGCADVNGDTRIRTNDITALVTCLNGIGYPYVANCPAGCGVGP
jgi:hypothetical protein